MIDYLVELGMPMKVPSAKLQFKYPTNEIKIKDLLELTRGKKYPQQK